MRELATPMPPPPVSIVIPLYNAEAWIAETLQSVLAQTYDHALLELIIVNDKSSDNSVAVAKQTLKDSTIHYEILDVGFGDPSLTRNYGWRHAKSEWIQFLDADDLLHPDKIAHQAASLPALGPQVAVVYSEWQRIARTPDGAWAPYAGIASPKLNDPVVDLLVDGNFMQLGSQLYRRSWLATVGGFVAQRYPVEDVNLYLRLAMAGGEFCHVPAEEPLSFYRQLDGSISRNAVRFYKACVANAELVEEFLTARGDLTEEQRLILARAYAHTVRYYALHDKAEFERLTQKIDALVPGFPLPGSAKLQWLARLVGYRQAVRIAIPYLRLRGRG